VNDRIGDSPDMTIFDPQKRAGLENRLKSLAADASPKWGLMNTQQMCCHLSDGFRMALGEKPTADTSNFFFRTVLRPLVVHVLPFPKNVPTIPELNQDKLGTPATDFESDRETLLGYVEKLCSCDEDFKFSPHGKFGPMSRKEWGILAAKHIDHHLKQFGV